MASGEHHHHFDIVLKTVIHEVTLPDPAEVREVATIYKQCSCGCVNKTEALVTHFDGRPWSE